MMNPKKCFCVIALLAIATSLAPRVHSQEAALPRPRVLGIAHLAVYVHDFDRARAFYKDFLGYAEPFSIKNPDGSLQLTFIKINDHQFIELFPEKTPNSDRLEHIGLEVENAEGMRLYLKSKGVPVPETTDVGKSGTAHFDVKDPDGHTVRFCQYLPDGWVARDTGKDLPDTRVSPRMPHCGIMVHNLDASLRFYRDIVGCVETWRGSSNGKVLSWVNLRVPDGRDYLEFMLYDTMPALARVNTMHHACLEVASVAKTGELMQTRPLTKESKTPTPAKVGVNGKWQINYYDPDGTRIEVMEPTTHDGKPVPPSKAPPPGSG